MSILRDISRAKALLRAVGNITQTRVPPEGIVVEEGDMGESMYTVLEVNTTDVRVRYLNIACATYVVSSKGAA